METSGNDRVLRQVMATVLGLAALAERLQTRCFAVRFLVLLVLRRAEAVTLRYLSNHFLVDDAWFDDDVGGSGPAAAAALAERFYAMAAALRMLLEPDGIPGGRRRGHRGALRRAVRPLRAAAAPRLAPIGIHDTS